MDKQIRTSGQRLSFLIGAACRLDVDIGRKRVGMSRPLAVPEDGVWRYDAPLPAGRVSCAHATRQKARRLCSFRPNAQVRAQARHEIGNLTIYSVLPQMHPFSERQPLTGAAEVEQFFVLFQISAPEDSGVLRLVLL